MFRINPNPTFKAKVALSAPGVKDAVQVTIEFRHKGRDDLRAWFEAIKDRSDAESLGDIISGWSGFDEKFSPETLASLIANYPTAPSEIFEAYRREILESRAKN